jgi:hypothetical protein
VYFDRAKTWHISELASYDLNQRKQGIDLTRGDTVQVQGGTGKTLGIVDMGLAGYALCQVRDDRGNALPEALRGARDRAFGLGPEVDITLAPIRSRITFALLSRHRCQSTTLRTDHVDWIHGLGAPLMVKDKVHFRPFYAVANSNPDLARRTSGENWREIP